MTAITPLDAMAFGAGLGAGAMVCAGVLVGIAEAIKAFRRWRDEKWMRKRGL